MEGDVCGTRIMLTVIMIMRKGAVIMMKTATVWRFAVRLLDLRDGRQAGGLAGKQTVSPGGIPALSGCHYLSVSISPSTGLAYR